MKKIINIKHHLDDYECMWNGIEDLYINSTSEVLPLNAFMTLASFGTFCYLKQEKSDLKRMIAFGDGRTKQMYEFMAPIAGFDYKFYECSSFEKLMVKLRKEIDSGYPVVVGALDMFHLSYLKMYHKYHIPFHYVLVVGYDDENKEITLLDCGRKEPQTLSYNDFSLALDCSYPGLSKPNTIITIRMNDPHCFGSIVEKSLNYKKELFLNPPVGFIGYKGFEKFVNELPKLPELIGINETKKILSNMVQFLATVPTMPNRLLGINKPDHCDWFGGFDRIERVLMFAGEKYGKSDYIEAALLFSKGKAVVSKLKDQILDYVVDGKNCMNDIANSFIEMKDIMISGFAAIR